MHLEQRRVELEAKRQRLVSLSKDLMAKPTRDAVANARVSSIIQEASEISEELRRIHDLNALIAATANPEAQDRARIERLNRELSDLGMAPVLKYATRQDVSKELRAVLRGESRSAMSEGTNNQGGYLVPSQFEDELVEMQKAAGPLFAGSDAVTNVYTSDGAARKMPTLDDLSNESFNQAEGTAATEADYSGIAQASLGTTTWSSGAVLLSNELLVDMATFSGSGAEKGLQRSLASRLSRAQNKAFLSSLLTTLGGNSSAAVAAGGASIAADDVHSLLYSVNASYRQSQKAAFLMNSGTAKAIAALKDSSGRFVYRFRVDDSGQVRLEGFKVYFSDYCDNVASTKNPVLFGDWSYCFVRSIPGIRLQVLKQRYAEQHSTGVIARVRSDLQYAVPSTSDSPVKYLHFA